MGSNPSVPQRSVYDFTVKNYKNQEVDLSIYKGKVLLIVNVASKCGYTNSNYTELTELYNRLKDKGSSEDAQNFVCERYRAEYPVFQKVRVNGQNTTPLYKFLKANSKSAYFGGTIKWNFTKFLINKQGEVIQRYGTTTLPLAIEADIRKALEE